MSVKSKALAAAAAALTVVGGASVAGNPSANAATPQCGPRCIEVFSPRFGTPTQHNFIESVRNYDDEDEQERLREVPLQVFTASATPPARGAAGHASALARANAPRRCHRPTGPPGRVTLR
jgi:hypothetical protein